MILRPILLASAASVALFATPAFAADTPAAESAEAASDTGGIIVTARRRQESAQSVPLAISVLGADAIERTGAFNVDRLQQQTPTVQFYSTNPRNSAINVRGLGAPFGLTNDGIEQGVGIYVDDVYYARPASSTFDFLDVQQIEILRGPQGTLYGKNTTAGAVNITSRAPTFTPEARGEVSFGNEGYKQVKAAVSRPLSDTVAARFAGSLTRRDGNIYNVATGQWDNSLENTGGRGQILWRPSAALDVTLSGDYNTQDPLCCGTVYYGYGATQKAANRQYPALRDALIGLGYAAPVSSTPGYTPYSRLTDLDSSLRAKNSTGGASLRVKWQVGPGTLTAISAWRFWDWVPSNDRDFTGFPITTKSNNNSQQNQYSQELRYAISTKKVDVQVGAFAFNQAVHTEGVQQQGSSASRFLLSGALANDPTVLNGLTSNNDVRLNATSFALYSQASWHVTDDLTLQPGARLNYDKKKGWYNAVVTTGSGSVLNFAPVGTTATAVQTAQLGVLAPQQFAANFSDWNFSYDFTANYRVARDVFAYATYAKSFKSGGINLNGVPADANGNPLLAAATVKPESVNHFELGVKSQWLNRTVTLNLAAFRTDISNYQAQVSNGALGVLRGYLANAEKVRTQGIEFDAAWRPSARFNAYVNGALTDAKYRQFTTAPTPPELSGGSSSPASVDISGQRLPGVSKWAFSWGGEYNVPVKLLGKDGEVYLGYDGSSRSSFSSNPTPSIYTWVDGYALHNFRAGYRVEHGIDVFAWVRNATNTNYVQLLTVASGNTGLIAANLGDPRTFGGTVKFQF